MILVTVGTTPFDCLIQQIDQNGSKDLDIFFQIASGKYEPKNFPWIRFTEEIDDLYDQSEFIISHAGAGSVFNILDRRKKVIVIPNMTRNDPHQKELAEFLHHNNYAPVCWNPTDIISYIQRVNEFQFRMFQKIPFFGDELLIEIIEQLYPQTRD